VAGLKAREAPPALSSSGGKQHLQYKLPLTFEHEYGIDHFELTSIF
jgi:hypothetical protein